jgi:hypothetical protein
MTYLTGGLAAESNLDAVSSMRRSELDDHSISLSGLSGDEILQSGFPTMTAFG